MLVSDGFKPVRMEGGGFRVVPLCSRTGCQVSASWQPVLEVQSVGLIPLKPIFCGEHRRELEGTWREYWGEERLRAKVREAFGDIGAYQLALRWE